MFVLKSGNLNLSLITNGSISKTKECWCEFAQPLGKFTTRTRTPPCQLLVSLQGHERSSYFQRLSVGHPFYNCHLSLLSPAVSLSLSLTIVIPVYLLPLKYLQNICLQICGAVLHHVFLEFSACTGNCAQHLFHARAQVVSNRACRYVRLQRMELEL